MFPTRRIITSGGDVFRDEYSLEFDGTNDNIRISSTTYDVDGSNVSFVFWVKKDRDDTDECILGNTGEQYFKRIYFREVDDTLRIESDTNADEAILTPHTKDFNWHHYAIICSSGTVTGYQDGIALSASGNVGDNNITLDTIGGSGTNGALVVFQGKISEVAIWNAALSTNQVKQLYNGREPFDARNVAKSNLISYWRMGDGVLDHRQANGLVADQVTATLGIELLGDGDFTLTGDLAANTAGTYWKTDGSSMWTISGGVAILTNPDGSGVALIEQSGGGDDDSIIAGKVYKVVLEVTSVTGSGDFRAKVGNAGGTLRSAVGTYTEYITASNTEAFVLSSGGADTVVIRVDNISVKQINGNAGVLVNFDGTDFKTDVPR
jgi:hypothetical protein